MEGCYCPRWSSGRVYNLPEGWITRYEASLNLAGWVTIHFSSGATAAACYQHDGIADPLARKYTG